MFNFIRNPSDPNTALFSSARGVLNANGECLKFYMGTSTISTPEILTESVSNTGDWASIAGAESDYSSQFQVNFFQRTLNFTISMEGISTPSV